MFGFLRLKQRERRVVLFLRWQPNVQYMTLRARSPPLLCRPTNNGGAYLCVCRILRTQGSCCGICRVLGGKNANHGDGGESSDAPRPTSRVCYAIGSGEDCSMESEACFHKRCPQQPSPFRVVVVSIRCILPLPPCVLPCVLTRRYVRRLDLFAVCHRLPEPATDASDRRLHGAAVPLAVRSIDDHHHCLGSASRASCLLRSFLLIG